MSWNIATRLNNLQQQINNKAGNPLTTALECNGNDIDNCGTLHYTVLDPPVGGSPQNLDTVLNTGNSADFQSIVDVSAVAFGDSAGVNQDIIISQLPGLGGRINIYQESDVISPFASSATVALGNLITTSNITCGGGLAVGGSGNPTNITLDGALILNEDGAPTGSTTLAATSANLLSVSGGITTTGNITCNTLNYTTLNPPVGGSPQNLQQTLTVGNDAGALVITNLGAPSGATDAATKGYVDALKIPLVYRYPSASGGILPSTISASSSYSVLWTSGAIPCNGQDLLINVQFANADNGGSLYANVLESNILISDNNFAGPFVPTDIIPFNQIPPATGIFWGPSFNGWCNVDGASYPSDVYVRIGVRQTLIGGGYSFNGADVLLTVYTQ